VTKHEKIYSLAVSKRASIQALVSKTWNDNSNSELEQYFNLKESVSTNERHKPPKEQPHDLEKLKKKDSKRSSRRASKKDFNRRITFSVQKTQGGFSFNYDFVKTNQHIKCIYASQ